MYGEDGVEILNFEEGSDIHVSSTEDMLKAI